MSPQSVQAASNMSEPFDPYRKWLGIPVRDQPPNHYRLLGIAHFEDDPDVIENAAMRQLAHVRTFQSGKHSVFSQKILNELTAAKICLLQPEKKAPYDVQLRAKLAAEGRLSSDNLFVESQIDESQGDEEQDEPASRWRTEEDEGENSAAPPIVPIPMFPPPVGVAVPPAQVPMIPVMRSSPLRTSQRARKNSSALPLAIMILVGVLLVGGGLAALAVSGVLQGNTPKPKVKPVVKTGHATTKTEFPIGSASKEKDKSVPANSQPPKSPLPVSNPKPAIRVNHNGIKDKSKHSLPSATSDKGPVSEQVRQAIFLARQALSERDEVNCRRYLVEAENLLEGNATLEDSLKQDVKRLREIKDLVDQFWVHTRAAVFEKLGTGTKFPFREVEFELVKHEGELVTFRIGDKEETVGVMELPTQVAVAFVYRAIAKENKQARLNLVAFLAVDGKSKGDEGRSLAKQIYNKVAREGHTHAGLAHELGIPEKPDPNADALDLDESEKKATADKS